MQRLRSSRGQFAFSVYKQKWLWTLTSESVSEFPIGSHSTQRGMCHRLCRGVAENCICVCARVCSCICIWNKYMATWNKQNNKEAVSRLQTGSHERVVMVHAHACTQTNTHILTQSRSQLEMKLDKKTNCCRKIADIWASVRFTSFLSKQMMEIYRCTF